MYIYLGACECIHIKIYLLFALLRSTRGGGDGIFDSLGRGGGAGAFAGPFDFFPFFPVYESYIKVSNQPWYYAYK